MPGKWQLLDRPTEYEAIRSALSSEDSCGVVLVGAAGVGKTTLARTVTSSLRKKVHWAACTESSRSIPLGAFAHWVRPSASRDPIALIGSARESLVADGDPVVGIDDAHLLDQLSATLLHQIAVERAGHVVATVRSGEPVPDAVTSLWKDGYLQRFELQPFTKQQSIALIETVLGGTLEGLSADVMWESSGGNPLFLRNMVEGAVDAGALAEVNGVWQFRGPAVIPSGLVELLDERLAHAGEDVLHALKLLSLCEPLDIDAFSELAGEEAVDAAEMRGLIRIVADDSDGQITARFSHPLFGEVVRRRVGTASARKLRGRIAQILRERDLTSAASRIRLAQLCVQSDRGAEIDLLITAAKDAVFLSNLPLGEQLARAAFDHGGGLGAAALLSRALLWQGHPAQADSILARFSPDHMDEMELVQWGVPRLSILFWSMGDVARANQVLELLNSRVTHPILKLIVDATGAGMAIHENRIAEGLETAERVLANPEAPRQAVDFAAFSAGLAMPVAGRGKDFLPIASRCRAQRKTTDGMIRIMVFYGEVLALAYTGQLELAERRAAEYAEFSSAGQFAGWAIAKIMAGAAATHSGRFQDAISAIEQALAALNAENSLPWQLPGRLLLARAYAAVGNPADAERVLEDAKEHSGAFMALHEPQRMLAKACVAAAKGGHRSAIDLSRAAADAARSAGQYAVEAEALHHAARFGDRTVVRRLQGLVDRVDGPLAALYARHAAAVAAADPKELDEVSTAFEEAGLLLSAADAAAQAVPLHDKAGQRRRSTESAAHALQLASKCGGAATPAIRSAARPLPVTSREREVAGLVAQGLSNREIAERLTVSVRTVEGHIYRAGIKLGVADRDDLAKIVWNDLGKNGRSNGNKNGNP
ncbi:tetratricopeptide repeat protein [Mycolicibacterium wolinskyi]|uniref:Helix-turn-helix transcriptional regulator n=1 Tax=Mycolicibacterium wolinskyi TaxID=59750 RepID=A0A1X2EV28_9MYCO|nr:MULTISPECIES: LuxR family transcriptional regulator [Mycolicibacterium]MCV7285794.1 tetratricopeptide repeat protein [Mycolicibacterium wolinskyi]MCV7297128.1 tetratricopeptide repeat protein [Mycolicibacterium goodii]ORX10033.1 helix-turn-helix transcriptional regulator [Mycolicibacterium wolinskyi]